MLYAIRSLHTQYMILADYVFITEPLISVGLQFALFPFVNVNPQRSTANNLIVASTGKVINVQSNHVNLSGVIFDGQTVINVEHLMTAVAASGRTVNVGFWIVCKKSFTIISVFE